MEQITLSKPVKIITKNESLILDAGTQLEIPNNRLNSEGKEEERKKVREEYKKESQLFEKFMNSTSERKVIENLKKDIQRGFKL